jgi:hypothetical protein
MTRAQQASWFRRGKDVVKGVVLGADADASLERLIGAVGADFFAIGDVRDLLIQGWKYVRTGEADGVIAALSAKAPAADQLYQPGSLIIPMDTTYQDNGMLSSYGLVYELLRHGVEVDWAIKPGKAYGGVDFTTSAKDLRSSATIAAYGYAGGPFVIDSSHRALALPVVQAWQGAHAQVAVHDATSSFTALIARQLLNPPDIAVFADGNEDIAFGYLNAAAIPMTNGAAWPNAKDNSGLYTCPGTKCCPDCLNEARTAGIEPVFTTPEHRRRGLARAVIGEGLRRVQRLGAVRASVSGYEPGPNALYSDVLSPACDRSEQWVKEW